MDGRGGGGGGGGALVGGEDGVSVSAFEARGSAFGSGSGVSAWGAWGALAPAALLAFAALSRLPFLPMPRVSTIAASEVDRPSVS